MTYESQWNEYRKRSRLFRIIFISYVPGVMLIGIPLGRLFNSEVPVISTALIWMSAFAVAGWRMSHWKCPRCGKNYFCKWYLQNQFARKCVHCRLEKWAK
jgi:hypothetical protein